ncbi:RDD family protein [Luteibacter rhizovicinus]|uniref:RDD family protein n=1 Tax=Luteibacter rhizovicinus TaxID=242606 RepID=A0A4R3YZW4_9GAMM|nr:RDD family protein [Luteibacter rhizovicinus]TCV97084.1 RDD family protein [Luteibacter rhizovicinus]
MSEEAAIWYYADRNGSQAGPVTVEQMFSLHDSGEIGDETLVWSAGMADWSPYRTMLNASRTGVSLVDTPDEESVFSRPLPTGALSHPWRRYFAKSLDISTSGFLGVFVIFIVIAIVAPDSVDMAVKATSTPLVGSILVLLVWFPIEAFCLAAFGSTPARWLFKIRVRTVDGRRLDFRQAFGRTIRMSLQGLGAGIPLISLVCSIVSYQRLTRTGTTAWDESQGLVVTHGEWSGARAAVATIVTIVALIVMSVLALVGE